MTATSRSALKLSQPFCENTTSIGFTKQRLPIIQKCLLIPRSNRFYYSLLIPTWHIYNVLYVSKLELSTLLKVKRRIRVLVLLDRKSVV